MEKKTHSDLITCICEWQNSIFIGILLFVFGVLKWAAEARIINPSMFLPDALMIAGILFALKGAVFSVFKK